MRAIEKSADLGGAATGVALTLWSSSTEFTDEVRSLFAGAVDGRRPFGLYLPAGTATDHALGDRGGTPANQSASRHRLLGKLSL